MEIHSAQIGAAVGMEAQAKQRAISVPNLDGEVIHFSTLKSPRGLLAFSSQMPTVEKLSQTDCIIALARLQYSWFFTSSRLYE